MPIDLTRRDLLRLGLVTAAGAGLAACTTSSSSGTAPTDAGGPEDPDRGLRAEIGLDEARLLDLYAAAAQVLTGATATRVTALGQRHAAYRAAIDPTGAAATSAPTTGSPSGSGTGSGAPSGSTATGSAGPSASGATPTTPAVTAANAVTLLAAAETRAAAARAAQAARAVDASLARVVALAGTGAAGAAAVLRSGRLR